MLLDNTLDSRDISKECTGRQSNEPSSGDSTSSESVSEDDEDKDDSMGASGVILERLENEDQVDKKVRLFEGRS